MAAGSASPGSTDSPDAVTCVGSTGSAIMSGAVVVFSDCGTWLVAVFVSSPDCFSPVGLAGFAMTSGKVLTGSVLLTVLTGVNSGVIFVSAGAVFDAISLIFFCLCSTGFTPVTVDVLLALFAVSGLSADGFIRRVFATP